MVNVALGRGNRGFITGTSGSGKTTLALALCEAMPSPLVVVDTKYDKGILSWAKKRKIRVWTKPDPPKWRDIDRDIVVRFRQNWLAHPEDIDWWLGQSFFGKYVPSIFIDEGYQVGATPTKMGEGVTGLWTRGRVFGFCTLIGTQRPAWISRFVVTESDRLFIGALRSADDRKAIVSLTGQQIAGEKLPKREFLFIDQDDDMALRLKPLDLSKVPVYDPQVRLMSRILMEKIR